MYWDKKKERRQKFHKRDKAKNKDNLKENKKIKEDNDDFLENRNPKLPRDKDRL